MLSKAKFFLSFLVLMFSSTAWADSQVIGDYTVHYIAVNSTFIDADIAAQYDIRRGPRRAFLNVSILKNNTGGGTTPVTAALSGTKNNLLGQSTNIEFNLVTEGDAIYYIGQFDFSNAENLRFEIEVQPESNGRDYNIEWNTQLYAN